MNTFKITSRIQPGTRRITLRTGQTAEQVRDYMSNMQKSIAPAFIDMLALSHDGMSAKFGTAAINSYPEQ